MKLCTYFAFTKNCNKLVFAFLPFMTNSRLSPDQIIVTTHALYFIRVFVYVAICSRQIFEECFFFFFNLTIFSQLLYDSDTCMCDKKAISVIIKFKWKWTVFVIQDLLSRCLSGYFISCKIISFFSCCKWMYYQF